MSIRPLKPEYQKIAESILNEIPNRRNEDLEHIKEWLLKRPHIKARMDDQWLIIFLRGCKFSLERTKEKLDAFYTIRKLMPELFSKRDPLEADIQDILKTDCLAVLPNTLYPSDPKTALFRVERLNPAKHSAVSILKLYTMLQEIILFEDDLSTINGLRGVLDLKNLNYQYATQVTPDLLKKFTICIQYAYPVRIKSLTFVNSPLFVVALYEVLKLFLSEKLKKRVHFYTGACDDPYKGIPKGMLPKDVGGGAPSWSALAAELKLKAESYRDWFLDDVQYCTDETKRTIQSGKTNNLFGLDGSFRKLDID